jgi:phosphoserine aminotransferase
MVTFFPGPSQVYPQIETFLADAFTGGILTMSHRSPAFDQMSKETMDLLRSKLAIPDDYAVVFTSSATECWEISAQSLTRKQSVHFSSGSFGDKWFQYAQSLHPDSRKIPMSLQVDLYPESLDVLSADELICLTQNETSNGTQIGFQTLSGIRGAYPDRLLALDCTSSMAGIALPFSLGDIWFASVQKCFGLPAGLGLMVLSPAAIERAKEIGEKRHYNSLLILLEHMEKYQTSCTPNVLGIYLLNRVLQIVPRIEVTDTLLRQRQADYLHALQGPNLQPLISNAHVRSTTVIAVKSDPEYIAALKTEAKAEGFLLGSGYGKWKADTFRIANFPAYSQKEIDPLLAFLKRVA